MKKNILMTLVFFILLTTSWASQAKNWGDPVSLAQEYTDDANYSSPRHFVRKWMGHHFTHCRYGSCTETVGKREILQNHREWKRNNPGSECTVTSAWWEGNGRLGFTCSNGWNDLLIFNQNGKLVREEVRS
ncbi:hypothetical protein CF386_08370 [Paraphotobacterium marinum]|uniref:Uncharacterized protein n=1 Tax=Paraphotobacterium marinum TaxID=1755811 RepID=A0A220VFB2_9GAMM|nr:hypothetical protein [Paraphotobacterium marinum]ASK79074.1 hypothetical protein CF386_08370 [Paraphotobacterium marinum]